MSRSSRNGLARIEVLVIIATIVTMVGLLLPASRRVRTPSETIQCRNNLKQLMLALHSYEDMGKPDAPNGHLFPLGCVGPGTTPESRLSWVVAILPYMELESQYQQFDLEKGYTGNLPYVQTKIMILHCPSAKGMSDESTNYVAMSGISQNAAEQPVGTAGNGFMGYDRLTSLAMIKDGSSNTIALMETHSNLGPWARGGSSTLRGFDPANVLLSGNQPSFGGHASGMITAMADGSVRSISTLIDTKKLAAAITIADGELFKLD